MARELSAQRLVDLLRKYTNATKERSSISDLRTMLRSVPSRKRYHVLTSQFNNGKTALHKAAELGNAELIECMLEGLPVEEQRYNFLKLNDAKGQTAIHKAIYTRQREPIDCLVNKLTPGNKYNILKMQDKDRRTALHFNSTLDIVECMLSSIASELLYHLLSIQDCDGKTPIHCSESESLLFILNTLAPESRYDLLAVQDTLGHTVLHFNDSETVKNILGVMSPESRYNLLRLESRKGNTALHVAVQKQCAPLTEHIFKSLEPEEREQLSLLKNDEGMTALDIVLSRGDKDMRAVFYLCKVSLPDEERLAEESVHPTIEDAAVRSTPTPLRPPTPPHPVKPVAVPARVAPWSFFPTCPRKQITSTSTDSSNSVVTSLQSFSSPTVTNLNGSMTSSIPYAGPASYLEKLRSSVPDAEESAQHGTVRNERTEPSAFSIAVPLTPKPPSAIIAEQPQPSSPSVIDMEVHSTKMDQTEISSSMVVVEPLPTVQPSAGTFNGNPFMTKVKGQKLKVKHGDDKLIFPFIRGTTVGQLKEEIARVTKAECITIDKDNCMLTGYIDIRLVEVPFRIVLEDTINIVTEVVDDIPPPPLPSRPVEKKPKTIALSCEDDGDKKFGRIKSAEHVVELLTHIHALKREGKTVNSILQKVKKDRKSIDRFKNIYYLHIQNRERLDELIKEWQSNGRQGALPGLNDMAKREIDWKNLEVLAGEHKLSLYGGKKT